ncbi:ATP-binding protein [Vibrio furnissii]|uniref:ATP-binding protein n=1 Tax=Vibrio furnissii TaxID=29494 RepID=UPI0001B91D0E|nr:ATP-binding protein [Vibrio furnissii]EEX41466.1 signal transduction histidine kinase [Vibrio furnissii CIP 102972]QDC93270.1 ATP-binding protein [Vibrio furnissii]UON48105.1 ATP-binding protein [Vibrio furnissii]SUP45698.1 sensor histidine kinase [Vibrio furnissii]
MPNRTSPFKRLSLKSRLLLAATLWLSAMILSAGYIIPSLVKDYLVSDVKTQLRLSMDEITANLEANNRGSLSLAIRLSDPRFYQPYSGLYWTASVGSQELRSRSLWDKALTKHDHGLKTTYLGAKDEPLVILTRTVYLPEFSNPISIVIGVDEAPIMATLNQVVSQLWVILGMLFIGVLVLISAQISWSLWPLGKMQKELVALRKGEQSGLDETYPKEISPLVNDLNALLFHYQELLERARNHAGNLSHALKTPLSVLKNEVASLPPEQRDTLLQPITQIQNQIDYHLGRARMAGSANILAVKTCPGERVDRIAMAFDKVYAEREIVLVNELDSDVEVAVDTTDFDEMAGNLLENSYKWAHSLIRVHSRVVDKKWVEICIEDDGPGIDDSKLHDAVKRGVRLDETQPGTGLGLNIVSEMAHSYQGALTLSRSKLGGLSAVLRLKQPTL